MNPSYNEREVLALLQEESTQKRGFEMIVAQYSEQLYWQIRRMVLSHEDANDLLQNTFVKAWLNIDYFRAEAKLSTWLYRIALNECLTFLNKQRAASTVSLDAPEADTLQKLESDPYFSGDKAQMAFGEIVRAILRLIKPIGGARGMIGIPGYANIGWILFSMALTLWQIGRASCRERV